MASASILVENISKQYRLGIVGRKSISQDVHRWWYTVRGKPDPFLKIGDENVRNKLGTSEYVWALKGINFSVNKGDVLGIIGRNGAGKSTLLKILSKVTAPTTGNIGINGRLASLLEVGTGFNPELSGKDNIFLNGAILGMSKAEIAKKFDEIVEFSGVERYINTPVKRYSSGMYVRLAFAVAAHLEPQILIIDEVLAVGDSEFQKKCIKKMSEVARNENRTILFVSHDLKAVSSLCNKGLYLKNGTVAYVGDISETIRKYTTDKEVVTGGVVNKDAGVLQYNGITNYEEINNLLVTDDLNISISLTSAIQSNHIFIDLGIYNERGDMVIHTKSKYIVKPITISTDKDYTINFKIDKPNLSPGSYNMTLFVYEEKIDNKILLWIDEIPLCFVNSKNAYLENTNDYLDEVKSIIFPRTTINISQK